MKVACTVGHVTGNRMVQRVMATVVVPVHCLLRMAQRNKVGCLFLQAADLFSFLPFMVFP